MASSLLDKLTPSVDTDPQLRLRDMKLKSKRAGLEAWFRERGCSFEDTEANDHYDISVSREFTVVKGSDLDLVLLEVPGWILDDGTYARDLDAVRHNFRGKTVRFVAREIDLPCPAASRVFKDWKDRDEIDAKLAPWRYLQEWEKGRATLEEALGIPEPKRPPTSPRAPGPSSGGKVFISYSHANPKWFGYLELHLSGLAESPEWWSDKEIPDGADWFDDIQDALDRAKVAVLLVSPEFLASKFIRKHEIPRILEAAKEGRLTLIWMLLSACNYRDHDLGSTQAAHDLKKPLDKLSKADRNEALAKIAGKIKKAAES